MYFSEIGNFFIGELFLPKSLQKGESGFAPFYRSIDASITILKNITQVSGLVLSALEFSANSRRINIRDF